MAYNNYYQYPNMTVPQPQQIQNGGFISVRSEQEARMYPIAPGNSLTFKDETQPFVYVKTMGFNQMEMPVFKKYKMVEVESEESARPKYVTQDEFDRLSVRMDELAKAVDLFTDKEAEHV